MADMDLYSFPDNEYEALAMLYVQHQDLSGLTPEQLLDMYHEAYDKIRTHEKETRAARRAARRTL